MLDLLSLFVGLIVGFWWCYVVFVWKRKGRRDARSRVEGETDANS